MIATLALSAALAAAPAPADYSSKDLGFSATFPSSPAVGHASQKIDVGFEIPVDTVGIDRGPTETYMVTVTTYPPELVAKLHTNETLKSAQEASLTGIHGTLTKDGAAPFDGNPAREFWAKLKKGFVHTRLIFAGDRMYQVFALTPGDKKDAGDKFIQSFKLVGADAAK